MKETIYNTGDNYYPGDEWGVCDECGINYRKKHLKKRWDGFLVCSNDFEHRHPQEFVIGVSDKITVANQRQETYQSIINDDCTSTTGWSVNSGWTHNTCEFYHSSGSNTLERSLTGLISGSVYQLLLLISRYRSGNVTISLATSADESGNTTMDKDGVSEITFTSLASSDTVLITPSSDFVGSVIGLAVYPVNSSITSGDL